MTLISILSTKEKIKTKEEWELGKEMGRDGWGRGEGTVGSGELFQFSG